MRPHINALLILPFVLLAGPARSAAVPAAAERQRVYDGIMSDSDLYVGEGVVALQSFGGDLARAKESGRERSRANLAQNIRVRIVSSTTDAQHMGKDGSKEELSALSTSSSDLELEGVEYKFFEGLPQPGQMTVLATLSKEAYLRQSDHRIFAYRPLRAMRLSGGGYHNFSLSDGLQSPSAPPGSYRIDGVTPGAVAEAYDLSTPMSLGADLYWGPWLIGLGFTQGRGGFYTYEEHLSAYSRATDSWNVVQGRLGFEWTPWATRLQLALPLMAEASHASFDSYSANAYGLLAGLRLRYWATDRFAFDLGGLWHQGLSGEDLHKDTAQSMQTRYPRAPLTYSSSGPEFSIGVLWNGI